MREIPPPRGKSGDHPWIGSFLAALRREDIAPVTVRGYRSNLSQFAAWYDGYRVFGINGNRVKITRVVQIS